MPNDMSNPLQGSGDWLAQRVGCATASRMNDVLATLKSGKAGADRERYMKELLAERMTGSAMQHVITQPMRDGLAREPEARELYEAETGNIVTLVGFVPHPTIEYAGASPDGLVGTDGLVEIKCPTDLTYIEWLLAGTVPEKHQPQMLFQLACTRRKWCDFVAYNPNVRASRKRMFVRRFEPQAAQIAEIEDKVRAFLAEVDEAFDRLMAGE